MTRDFFFYGTLCHQPLLRAVLGRDVAGVPARLKGWRAHWAHAKPHPMLVEDTAAELVGVLVRGLTQADQDRLDFYEGGFDFLIRRQVVQTAAGPVEAQVYFTAPGVYSPAAPWSLEEWSRRFGAEVTATAGDVMRLYDLVPAEDVLARYAMMLVRGASRVRAAQDAAPARLRRSPGPDDVQVEIFRQPYARFFAVEEYDLRFRRFDGTMSDAINRAAFISGDAVTVLPYDPRRDRVLLVDQFRAGPYARGDRNPWTIEAIAGRIDPGETAEACARREAQEEAGLSLLDLIPVAQYYPSPGAKSEFLYSFIALADLPDGVAGVHGVASEAEDIRSHLVSFDALMALVESGEVANGPLLVTALWLQRERAGLRGTRS